MEVDISNDIMYSTNETIKNHLKVHISANKTPTLKNDSGVMRRGSVEYHTNKFVSQEKVEQAKKKE